MRLTGCFLYVVVTQRKGAAPTVCPFADSPIPPSRACDARTPWHQNFMRTPPPKVSPPDIVLTLSFMYAA